MTEALQIQPQSQDNALTLNDVTARVNLVHRIMETVMKKDTHFGTVPGCGNKMVLLKPGADVLATTFRLVPQFKVERSDLGNGHREYDVTCSMYAHDGALLGQGVGSASTMEKKYRWRKDGSGQRVENEDIADMYNTVLKIAKKRAHIDATLTVTGAADLFTQDLIDDDEATARPSVAMPKAKTAPPPPPATPGSQTVSGVIASAEKKTGKKQNGGEWTRWRVDVGGVVCGTFDTETGLLAEQLMAAKVPVAMTYQDDGKGHLDIVALVAAD
jgi:hypothetical protein